MAHGCGRAPPCKREGSEEEDSKLTSSCAGIKVGRGEDESWDERVSERVNE